MVALAAVPKPIMKIDFQSHFQIPLTKKFLVKPKANVDGDHTGHGQKNKWKIEAYYFIDLPLKSVNLI